MGGRWDLHSSRRLCGAAGFLRDRHRLSSYVVVDLLTVGKRESPMLKGEKWKITVILVELSPSVYPPPMGLCFELGDGYTLFP